MSTLAMNGMKNIDAKSIDRHNFPIHPFFHLSTNLDFLDCIPMLKKFLFAVMWLADCHSLDLDPFCNLILAQGLNTIQT
jgi:hypothetical protein